MPRVGPGSVALHMPHAHQRLMGLNRFLRSEPSLAKKLQELAMLVTARELDCQYIWNAHAASAREAGVTSARVDALRERRNCRQRADDETAVVRFGQEFFRTHRVSRGTFQLRSKPRTARCDRARAVPRELRVARAAREFLRWRSAV